jgi:hypothetical protein
MGAGHSHHRPPSSWGEPAPGLVARLVGRVRAMLGPDAAPSRDGLGELPVRLRRDPRAAAYLAAEGGRDHPAAAEAAVAAMDAAVAAEDWWIADVWAHRALWHYEQGQMAIEAIRQARRIGDLRWAAGDASSARRYYAEAIDEARDVGAEHEQGLAAFGLGRALLDLGAVSEARRLASAAVTLLERAEAPAAELAAARELLGIEVAVGERHEEGQ